MKRMVIVNGWSANSEFWSDFIASSSKQFDCQVVDLSDVYSVDEAMALIERYVTSGAVLLGWSLGGMLASYYAANMKHELSALVTLQSSPCFVEKDNWPNGFPLAQFESLYQLAEQKNYSSLCRIFTHLLVNGSQHHKEDRRALKPVYSVESLQSYKALLAGLDLLRRLDVRDIYSSISLPTLHVFGKRDELVSMKQVEDIKKVALRHSFSVIDDMGHYPCGAHLKSVQASVASFVEAL